MYARLPQPADPSTSMKRTWQLRAGPGTLIILAHLVFVAALIRYAGTPSTRGEGRPADDVTFVMVQATAVPEPAQAAAPTSTPTPPPAPRKPRAAQQPPDSAPSLPVLVSSVPAPQEPAPGQAAPQGNRLDMAALRADARRIAVEHVPEPFEQVREAERRLEAGKKDLGRAISDARRPPCTKKYSGGTSLNVFALIPLAIDTITDTGCKW